MRRWADHHTHNSPVVYNADYATNYSTDNFIHDTVHINSHHPTRPQSHHIFVLPEWHSSHDHHFNHYENNAVHYHFLSANSHTMPVRPCHH